jgi:protein-S-isoprenylcysteine O-methyltransferase Ste14
MACLGLAFSPYSLWKIAVVCALGLVLAAKAVIEEKQLRDKFAHYEAYAKKTKRLIPLVW